MRTYRLRKGFGRHICANGHVISQDAPIYETEERLKLRFPDKFEDVTGMELPSDHPWGINISHTFALCGEIPGCAVWRKGRRYRIAVNGKPLDTPRLTTEDEVSAALKAELKSIRAGQKEDDEDDEEIDEEEEAVEEDEDEEEEELVKPPKAKAKGKGKKSK